MKKCLVIDDDPMICDLIKHFCSKQDWIELCLSVGDGSQAIRAMDTQRFDLIFLDYNLPDLKGKELLKTIPNDLPVIMVTTEESFGAESYEYEQIIDFLVKPISYERFLKSIQRYSDLIQAKSESISAIPSQKEAKTLMVKDGNSIVAVRINTIKYIKSESNYVVFYLTDKKVMSLMSLKRLESDLPDSFIRVHKSYIVNLEYLDEMNADSVIVSGQTIPIGPKHKENLKSRLNNWMQ